MHSAGVLADAAILQQEWSRFTQVLGPKVDGSWALHVLTKGLRLDFFVMYSSVASVFGSAGQANHAAANAFMDASQSTGVARVARAQHRLGWVERHRRGRRSWTAGAGST